MTHFDNIIMLLQVSTNGVLSFRLSFLDFSSRPFPLSTEFSDVLIAPFWDDSDVRQDGQVLYRLSDNGTLLSQVGSAINDTLGIDFSPRLLFIATWIRIPEYDNDRSSVSWLDYQCVCMIDTDEKYFFHAGKYFPSCPGYRWKQNICNVSLPRHSMEQ